MALSPNTQRKPWNPATLLPDPIKDLKLPKEYAYRWEKDSEVTVGKSVAEQWEVVNTPKQYKVREMILMRMPKEIAEERAAYYQEKNRIQNMRATDLRDGMTSLEKHKTGIGLVSSEDEGVLDIDAMTGRH